MKNVYSLIMAGGSGTRFWPLSRRNKPKQFLSLSGRDLMVNETLKRCGDISEPSETFIITTEELRQITEESVPAGFLKENILTEPTAKNTAACMLYAALYILKKRGDGIICTLPADHYITENTGYADCVKKAIETAHLSDTIVTLGITAKYAHTGYGYIKRSNKKISETAYAVEAFTEKPERKTAEEYVKSGNYLWNSGIFVFKTSVVIDKYKQLLPKMYDKLATIEITSPNARKSLQEAYSGLENISFDYAVMERLEEAAVIPCDFEWNDAGSWDSLACAFSPDENGNIINADHIGTGTKNSVIFSDSHSGRLIATVGVSDLIVVDTGDALLICNRDNAQDIRTLLQSIRRAGRADLL